jgi:hypothetical protein
MSAKLKMLPVLLLLMAIIIQPDAAGLGVSPEFVGNGSGDSVYVTFVSIDTTYYSEVRNLDSLDILRYKPDCVLLDSTSENASNVLNPTRGFYRAAFRASDGSGTMGVYAVVVRGWLAGKERGIVSGVYEVIDENMDGYLSNLDSASVARSVWDDDIVAEIDRRIRYADSVGTVLNVPTSGSGAYACSLFYFDASDTTAIQGVFSRVMNNTQTATSGVGLTNSDGLVVISLDAAMYRIWSYLSGHTFAPLPDSVTVVSPSVVDTIWGTTFDPGDPIAPSLCRVYGWVRDLSGVAISGATVTASVKQSPLRYGSIIVSPYFRSTVSDSTGYWYLDLLSSANLDPTTTSYSFSIYYLTGAIAVKEIAVPDESSWELNW